MTDIISFYSSKIFWVLFAPSHIFILLLLLGIFLKRGAIKMFALTFSTTALLMCTFLPLGEWMALPLERVYLGKKIPDKVDGVVVLGGAVDARLSEARKTLALNGAAERVTTLIKLLHAYPSARFIYSGGSGSIQDRNFNEAETVKIYLTGIGLDPQRLIAEGESRNTYENALNTVGLISGTEQNWLIVTSATHMPRAMALFEKAGNAKGIVFHPYTTDWQTTGELRFDSMPNLAETLGKIDATAKEYLGLVINKLLGKTDYIWPAANPA